MDGRDTNGVGKGTPELPIDSITVVDAKKLKIAEKRTPKIPVDNVIWVDAPAARTLSARQSGYTSVNSALLAYMRGELEIPLYCLAVATGGDKLVISYDKVNTLWACYKYILLISLFRVTELIV